jgi:hypothetical protein
MLRQYVTQDIYVCATKGFVEIGTGATKVSLNYSDQQHFMNCIISAVNQHTDDTAASDFPIKFTRKSKSDDCLSKDCIQIEGTGHKLTNSEFKYFLQTLARVVPFSLVEDRGSLPYLAAFNLFVCFLAQEVTLAESTACLTNLKFAIRDSTFDGFMKREANLSSLSDDRLLQFFYFHHRTMSYCTNLRRALMKTA